MVTQSSSNRRTFIKLAGGVAGVGALSGCSDIGGGTDYPSQDITLVIPSGGGGGQDAYARLMAPYLAEHLPNDVDIVPTNQPGAGGMVGTRQVYNAEPDGYTILMGHIPNILRASIIRGANLDITRMSVIGQIVAFEITVGVGSNSGVSNWDEYASQTAAGELDYFTTGRASVLTLIPVVTGVLSELWTMDNVVDNLVVYDGRGQGIQAIQAGDIQVMIGGFSSLYQYYQSDIMRPIISYQLTDEPVHADEDFGPLPTLQSQGVPRAADIRNSFGAFSGFVAPPEMPDDRLETLQTAFRDAMNDEDFQSQAAESNLSPVYASPEEVREKVDALGELWTTDPLNSILTELTS